MQVKINKFDDLGNGIVKDNDKIIFVNRGLPDELVDIKVISEKRKYATAKIEKVLESNPSRITPICPYYNECGGCNFLHITKNYENDFKEELGKRLLPNFNHLLLTSELNYRNKVTLHIENNRVGFYKEKSHDLIAINYCYLLNDKINYVIEKLNKYLKDNKVSIEQIVIKYSSFNQILMDVDGIIDNKFINYFNDVDTIVVNNEIVKGLGYIEEIIDGLKFKISAKSFFQVNKLGLLEIKKLIEKYLSNTNYDTLLDLYSGTSIFGILVSKMVKKVITVEMNKSSVGDALVNKEVNKINNIDIICGTVEDNIDKFKNIDVIIIDPPRSGLDKKSCDTILKINPKLIIYISCDIMTLKRDINVLSEQYDIEECNMVDMFPRTYHVENVCILKKKYTQCAKLEYGKKY